MMLSIEVPADTRKYELGDSLYIDLDKGQSPVVHVLNTTRKGVRTVGRYRLVLGSRGGVRLVREDGDA